MRKFILKKQEEQAEGYKEFILHALANHSYTGPELLRVMDIRDIVRAVPENAEVVLTDTDWEFIKAKVNETKWSGAFCEIIAPFIRDVNNAQVVQA